MSQLTGMIERINECRGIGVGRTVADAVHIGHPFDDARIEVLVIDNSCKLAAADQRRDMVGWRTRYQQMVVKNEGLDTAGIDADVENMSANIQSPVRQIFRNLARLFEDIRSRGEDEPRIRRIADAFNKSRQL